MPRGYIVIVVVVVRNVSILIRCNDTRDAHNIKRVMYGRNDRVQMYI